MTTRKTASTARKTASTAGKIKRPAAKSTSVSADVSADQVAPKAMSSVQSAVMTAAPQNSNGNVEVFAINGFIATEAQKVFTLSTSEGSHMVYFGNNDQHDTIGPRDTYNTLGFQSDGIVYQNLYDSSEVFYKSAIYGKGKSQRTDTTFDFQNITNHKLSSQLCSVLQIDNIIYALEGATPYGHYGITEDIYAHMSSNNGQLLPDNVRIETVIYDRDYIQERISNDLSVDSQKAVKTSYGFLGYNMVYEIPGTVQNDYQSGNIAANTFKAKNQYNSLYDMGHSGRKTFSDCRQYVGIDKCGDLAYLRYYDRYGYTAAVGGSGVLTSDSKSDMYGYKMQHVEVLGSVNRYASINGHKSNVYSIVIKTNLLKEALAHMKEGLKQKIKENLSKEVANIGRKIAESLQPAQTQLLSVYVQETT